MNSGLPSVSVLYIFYYMKHCVFKKEGDEWVIARARRLCKKANVVLLINLLSASSCCLELLLDGILLVLRS